MSIKINRLEGGHNSDPLVCRQPAETVPSKGDKYVIDEELKHTDHLFLGVAYLESDDNDQLSSNIYDKLQF
jgi:hypothetical protein